MLTLSNPADIRAAEKILWEKGEIQYLLHPDAQARAFKFTDDWKKKNPHSAKPIVWDNHRAWGKTFALVLYCIRRCLKYEGQEVRFAAPSITQCIELVEPNFVKILEHCPPELMPVKKGDYYIFKNPSWEKRKDSISSTPRPSYLRLVGCRERADSHRGKRSNVVVFDECRDIDAFEYVARNVFGPHFAKMWYPVQIMSSTPPESMDHAWSSIYCFDAQRDARYFACPVTQDRDWTPVDDKTMIELFIPHAEKLEGPELKRAKEDSIDWQREMECKHISDPSRLIIPEFSAPGAQAEIVVKEYNRPTCFQPVTIVDFGYQDFTAAIFTYVDFLNQKWVIEDELWVHQRNSGQLRDLIENKEKEVWWTKNHKGELEPPANQVIRHGDLTRQTQADLAELLQFVVLPVDKTEKAPSISACRLAFTQRQIRIHECCTHLIYQLRNGRYAKNRKDFQRSESESLKDKMGHCDLLAALIYGHRMANWGNNPYPPGRMQVGHNFSIPIPDDPEEGTLEILEIHETRIN